MQNNLLPNRDAIKSHLNQLFGGAKDGLIEVAYTPANSKAVNQAEFFNVTDIEKAVDFIVKVNSQDGVNTYVGSALRNPNTAPFMRSNNEDYYLSNYVWADLDDADSAKNAKEKYKDLPPSFVVVTGRHPDLRAQVWWKLATPEQDKSILKNALAHVCSALEGDKAVVDPARVMRVGGSIAWPKKDGRKPELTEFIIPSSRTDSVSIDDLTSHYPLADFPVDKPQSASGAVGLFSPPRTKLFHDNKEWSVEDIEGLLEYIHPDNEYLGWVKVGMALKDYGLSFAVWDKWSQTGAKYDAKIMRSKWDSFKGSGTTIGSLVYQAKQSGWQPKRFEPFITPVMQENHIPDVGNMVETVNQETGEVTYETNKNDIKRVLPLIYADEVQPVTHCTDFVEDLLRDNEFSVIYGASNCGKTFFMLDLAMHVALGKEWRGKEVEQGGVIYAALEGGHGTKNRIVAFKNHYQITDKIPLAIIPSNINFLDGKVDMPAFLDAIEGAKKRLGKVRLIVVDTLARAISGGDENSGQDMGQLIINADKLREMTNAHISFVHHSGKDDLKGARGHSSLRAAVDTEIEVSRPDTESPSTIKIVKQREMEMIDDMSFSLSRVVLGVNERGKEVTSCVVMPCDVVEKKTTARMNPIQTFMYDAILDCMDRFGEIRFVQKDMPNVKSIRYEELREVLEMRGLKGMMEQEKKSTAEQVKSATQTARVALKKMGKINFNGVYVWLVS